MRLNKDFINEKRKANGHKGRPGSKMNKRLTITVLKRRLEVDRIMKSRDQKWLKNRIAELKEREEKEEQKKAFREYRERRKAVTA